MTSYSDQESGRLPEGFTRTGYDADTETYTYTDENGTSYTGLPGNRYGRLYPTGSTSYHEALSGTQDRWNRVTRKQWFWQTEEWKYLSTVLLLVGVTLIGLIWWIGGSNPTVTYVCGLGERAHVIQHGDTCYKVAQAFNVDVDELKGPMTKGDSDRLALICDHLSVGGLICAPEKD